MEIFKTLLLTLLVGLTIQQCNTGCLMCSQSNVCTLCDITNSFILNGNTCVASTMTNCAILTTTGTCGVCSPGYYLNTSTGTCVQITSVATTNNCLSYSTTQVCALCNQGYYILNGQCIAVTSAITNCLYYASATQCYLCASGYIFSNDWSICVASPNVSNCDTYSYIVCTACKSGYYQNKNNYLTQNYSTSQGIYSVISRLSTFVNLAWTPQVECVIQTTVSNCKSYALYNNTCTACNTGYYLNGNSCILNPYSIILNCSKYSSLTACIQCNQNYYLSSSNSCLPVTTITNCLTYDGTQSTSVCASCNSGFYVSNNACTVRINSLSILNCQTLSNNSDVCATCNPSFVITTDARACLPVIPNCSTYSSSSYQNTALTCTLCVDNYYLGSTTSSNTCVAGSVSACKTYSINSNVCTVCNNGYYLSNQLCVQHVNIPGCATYSQSTGNTCNTCSIGYYGFALTNVCTSVPSLANCLTYASDGKSCTSCNSGFYLNSGNLCNANPAIANCKTFKIDGTCSFCNSNYLLISGACVQAYDFITTNCFSYDFTAVTLGLEYGVCNQCQQSNTPYSLGTSTAVCVSTTLAFINMSFTKVDGCVKYTNLGKCMECDAGQYLKITETTPVCSATCAGITYVIILDNLDGRVNLCVKASYLNPMTGEGSSYVAALYCKVAARVGMSTDNIIGTDVTKVLGNANEPAVTDYVCVTPSDTTGTSATAYDTFYYPAVAITRLQLAAGFAIKSNVFHKLGELTIAPSLFNYRGIGLSFIGLAAANGLIADTKVTVVANCVLYMKYTSYAGGVNGAPVTSFKPAGVTYAYLCQKCDWNYLLQIKTDTLTAAAEPAIGLPLTFTMSCASMSLCDANVIYTGFPSYLTAILSCHQCKLPTTQWVVYSSATAFTPATQFFIGYQLSNTATTTITEINCYTLSTPANQKTNCLIYAFTGATAPADLVATVTDAVIAGAAGSALTCVACAPGYSTGALDPYTAAAGAQILTCSAIANCATSSTMVNGCSACTISSLVGTTTFYYAFSDTTYSACVQVKTANCFIGNTLNDNKCTVCKSGYFLNYDSVCESLILPNCATSQRYSDYQFSSTVAATASGFPTYIGLAFQGRNGGCSLCSTTSLVRIQGFNGKYLCVPSSYVASNTFISGTVYIVNCLNYQPASSAQMQCKVCQSGYIPSDSYKSCGSIGNYPNCLVFSATITTQCSSCNSAYVLINGLCYAKTIANCSVYAQGQSKLMCSTCLSGFVQSSDQTTCSSGLVSNCDTYQQGQTAICLTCKTGYALLNTVNSGYYCYPIPTTANCMSLYNGQNQGLSAQQFQCTSCPAPTSQLVYGLAVFSAISNYLAQPQTICLQFPAVPNCISYGTTYSITISQLTCTGCATGFYLSQSTNTCVARTITSVSCVTYNPTADQCTACDTNTFLNPSIYNCQNFPNGIFQCNTYSSATVCTQCNAPYYLLNNGCQLSTVISNCAIYAANYTCSAASQGYVLVNSTYCQSAVAVNCYTYTDINTCASCDPTNNNLGLQTNSNGITNCITKNVANCVVSTNVSPFLCTQCTSGFYPSSGVCVQVSTTITNCYNYDSAVTCLQCNAPFVLNAARSLCLNISGVDQNCKFLSLLTVANCSACKLQFWFVNGVCASCPNSQTTGCYNCHPTGGSNCISCQPGYYMTVSGTCTPTGNVTIITTTTTTNFTGNNAVPTTTTTTTTTASNSMIMNILASVFFFMIWLI